MSAIIKIAFEFEGVGSEYTYKVLIRKDKMDTGYLHTRTDGFFSTSLILRDTHIYILARPNSGAIRVSIDVPAPTDPQQPYRFAHETKRVSKVTQKFVSNFTNMLKQVYNAQVKMSSLDESERQASFENFLASYTSSKTELAYPHVISEELDWMKHAIIYLSDWRDPYHMHELIQPLICTEDKLYNNDVIRSYRTLASSLPLDVQINNWEFWWERLQAHEVGLYPPAIWRYSGNLTLWLVMIR